METNVPSLLNLNDDCLDVIFKHMKIVDQINLASCCCRLRDVFVMRTKAEYKVLDLEILEHLTLWQKRSFLQMVGPHIAKFSGCRIDEHAIEFLGIYCINVKSISIIGERLSANTLRKLLWNTYVVEELNLVEVILEDDCIPVLQNLKNIKTLMLAGRDIKNFTAVETLSLHMCFSLTPTYFKMICENLKDLKYLDIRDCRSLNTSSLDDIVMHLNKLETIKLNCEKEHTGCVASLPNLKNLYLHSNKTVPIQILQEVAKLKSDQLEVLEVVCLYHNAIQEEGATFIGELRNLKQLKFYNNGNLSDKCLQNLSKLHGLEVLYITKCNGFTATGLLDLIQKCRKLKTLDVSYCKHLDVKFATKLLALLTSERIQREQNKLLKLIARYSGIQLSAVKSSAFEEASDILSISFDLDDAFMIYFSEAAI